MTAKPPPMWEESLSADDMARRLASLKTGATPADIFAHCFARDFVFSCGVDAMDRLLPDGGVACGTVLELYGPPASGKSTIARRMAAAFAARGALGFSEWGICFALSDPNAFCPKRFAREVREAVAAASASNDAVVHHRDGDTACSSPCRNEETRIPGSEDDHDIMRRIQVVSFQTPDELLRFFRFLYQTEFPHAGHHQRRRRLLVIVDSVARLWDSPACGESSHARQWIAAEITRAVRNAVAAGSGWRGAVGGAVGVVLLGGAGPRRGGASPAGAAGTQLWLAAAADVRLFVEPLWDAAALVAGRDRNAGGGAGEDADGAEEEGRRVAEVSFFKMRLRVHLVKGGKGGGNCVVTL